MHRPQAHVTGELGEIEVASLFIRQGWQVTKLAPDYGFDFLVQPATSAQLTGDLVLIQVKTTAKHLTRDRIGRAAIRVPSQHVRFWRTVPIPALLVLVELPSHQMYVRACQAIAARLDAGGRNSKTTRVTFAPEDLLCQTTEPVLRRQVTEFWTQQRGYLALHRQLLCTGQLLSMLVTSIPRAADHTSSIHDGIFKALQYTFGTAKALFISSFVPHHEGIVTIVQREEASFPAE